MDAGFSRESFWGVIEGRFNDANLKLHLNMVGNVDEVDSRAPPPCHRSASFLKDKFLDARSSFTVCVENWSQSGQNEISNFKFFAGLRHGELTAAGKRNMVLFVCARLGTENHDSRFRNMCLRTIPFGRGVDEGGSSAGARLDGGSNRDAGSRRNSRRTSGADNDSADQSVVQLSEFIIERGRRRLRDEEEKLEERRERRQQRKEQHEELRKRAAERRDAKKSRKRDRRSFEQFEANEKLIKFLRYTTETLKSQGQDSSKELLEITRRQHQAVFRAFKVRNSSQEGQEQMSVYDEDEQCARITRSGGDQDSSSSDEDGQDDRDRSGDAA